MSYYCQSSYLRTALDGSFVKLAVKTIKRIVRIQKLDFDTVVFRGMSGSLIAPLIANTMGKHLLMVRKDDNSHSSYTMEGNIATKRYIILDDLINTGGTIKKIMETLYTQGSKSVAYGSPEHDLRKAECVGIILYHSNDKMHEKYKVLFKYVDYSDTSRGEIPAKLETKVYPFFLTSKTILRKGSINQYDYAPYLERFLGERKEET